MNTQSTQQYHEFIRGFFTLFDEIKKEDDPIYNSRIGFNAVKFLIKHADWDWNKDKVYEVVFQECDNAKKAEQKFESEVKARLKEYVDDVAGVSIYGDHASITLGDDKKEFKISEFLNSDFCQKKGISGFSTLHSDGKSGMHGFVAEEGEKRIRHYVVTDGSYEMTLNWHDKNGKKCTIKIKIDKYGVDLIERNGVTAEQLEANKDVKIGGLFLHQIQFREKGQGKSNEMKESSEIAIKSNSRDIEQEVKKPVQKHQATHMNREIGSQTPPLPPLRTSSLPPKENVANEQGRNASAKPVSQDGGQRDKQNNPTPNNQQKGATSDPPDSSTFTKSVSHNQDNRQEDKRYDNPTFGHAIPGSQKPDRSEQTPNNQQQPKTQQQEGNSKGDLLQDIRNFKRNSLRRTGVVDGSGASMEGGRKNESTSSILETLKDKVPYLPYSNIHEHDSDNRGASDAEWEESKQQFPVLIPKSTNSSSYSSPEAPEEHGKNSKSETHKVPITNPADQVWLKDKIEGKENNQIISTEENIDVAGLLKDNAAETKINDSGYSSPTYTSHYNFQVNPEQLEKRLETIEQKETLENLNKGLREPSRQATKDLFSENMLEKIKEGEKYDPVRKLLERKVAEQENDNTNLTIDKNSELYKLLEKDAAQLKAGIVEEERKDTLTERNDSPDRNRIALANKNRKLLWTKRIADKQEKNDGISIG
ncbi:hypothetical protein [Wolbachia endosymbiont (group B) of Gerris lacustris]|uniref:hypothetical protein n=1 Tax=Wolbachia endosymbiont (group B) of Gerris lacustris TaxID=3066159 RepID=UPI00334278BF